VVPSTIARKSVCSGRGRPLIAMRKSGVSVEPSTTMLPRAPAYFPVDDRIPPMPLIVPRSALLRKDPHLEMHTRGRLGATPLRARAHHSPSARVLAAAQSAGHKAFFRNLCNRRERPVSNSTVRNASTSMKLFSSSPKSPPFHQKIKTLVHGAWLREKGLCPERAKDFRTAKA
jgi:hypothetical protein